MTLREILNNYKGWGVFVKVEPRKETNVNIAEAYLSDVSIPVWEKYLCREAEITYYGEGDDYWCDTGVIGVTLTNI